MYPFLVGNSSESTASRTDDARGDDEWKDCSPGAAHPMSDAYARRQGPFQASAAEISFFVNSAGTGQPGIGGVTGPPRIACE
jgi:hypothetical protein